MKSHEMCILHLIIILSLTMLDVDIILQTNWNGTWWSAPLFFLLLIITDVYFEILYLRCYILAKHELRAFLLSILGLIIIVLCGHIYGIVCDISPIVIKAYDILQLVAYAQFRAKYHLERKNIELEEAKKAITKED